MMDEDTGRDDKFSTGEDPILPEHVISIDASDDFLKDRASRLSETEAANTNNTEEGSQRHAIHTHRPT